MAVASQKILVEAIGGPMKAQHTPTPWKIGSFGTIYSGTSLTTEPVLEAGYYHPICIMDDWKTQREDAAFIVRAINTHEELLATAKHLLDLVADFSREEKPPKDIQSRYDDYARAIAKAEGK